MAGRKPQNYINNKDFLAALNKYKQECAEGAIKGDVRPKTKTYDYIGKCFLMLATKIMNRPNFYNYSYKQEMISDAIRRIKSEHRQRDIKAEVIKRAMMEDIGEDDFGQSHEDLLKYYEKPETTPLEKKFKRPTKAHQKKMKELEERIAIEERAIQGIEPQDPDELLDESIDESEEIV